MIVFTIYVFWLVMSQVDMNGLKKGMKVELDSTPFNVVNVDLVKPGKGQSFARIKLKNLKTGQVVEKTYKSHERIDLADVHETAMRLIYTEADAAVFMDDKTYEQMTIPLSVIGENCMWLKEETSYGIIFHNGEAVDFIPPTFMELKVTQADPGERGNTASGRVEKKAVVETGAEVMVPIFINEGEIIKIDTRTSEYVNRA